MKPLPFTKMHGIGNHYVYVNGFAEHVDDPPAVARAISDVHRGIGADGLILVLPPEDPGAADARMRMFNADGSEAEMCGNGIRCVCKLLHDRGIARGPSLRVETGAGVLTLAYTVDEHDRVDRVTVDMGAPGLAPADLPADPAHLEAANGVHHRLAVEGTAFDVVLVSMGNPHAVAFVPAVADVDLARLGPAVEHHPAFPQRVNMHFVEVTSSDEVVMRTWERGSGATLACGTGAAAVCVAGARSGRTDRRVLAHLPGGDLDLEWDERTGHVMMTGPAREVFSGEWYGER
jgi:diaminopimelate epimerase